MKTVISFRDPFEANIVRAKLIAAGIDAIVTDELTVQANWFYSLAIGGVKVQVPDGDIALARNILAEGTD